MSATLSPVPKLQFFDANGAPLAGGKLYSYIAGTTTPQSTYTDSTGATANANPVILDSRGEAGVWLADDAFYKLSLYTSDNVLVWTVDQIASNTTLAALAASGGSSLVGFIQSGTGAVATTVQSKLRESVSVTDYGADPTGVIDSTTTIQAAIDAALAAGKQIIAQGTFRTSAKIVIKGDADFSQATLNVYSTPAVAVEVSTGNATNPTTILNNSVIWLPKRIENMTKPGTGWAAQGVGVRVVNAYSCQIWVGDTVNFATGLLCTSFGFGNTYNNYYLGHLENNQVNLALTPGNSGAWVNENNFIGGRFSHYSAEGTGVAGTRHILMSKASNSVNNNLFIKPSIEGDVNEYNVENGGSYNTIQQGRWESTTPKVLYTADNANQASSNYIIGGYNANAIAFTYVGGVGGSLNRMTGYGGDYITLSSGQKIQNQSSSSNGIHLFYEAGTRPETAGATEWSVKHGSQTLEGKRKADSATRLKLDYVDGRVYVGNGSASPTAYIGAFGSSFASYGTWYPGGDNTYALGASNYRWTNTYSINFRPGAGTATWTSGAGTPEGAVTATVGSLYTRTDGGATTTLYVKESGTGNTGWVAK